MTHGPRREDFGWVDFKFLEVYEPDQDLMICRDALNLTNGIPWYHVNPHRNGSIEDAEKISRYLKYMPNFQSLGFLMGYCVIGLKDEGREYDLESLPKMLESWPVRYELRKDERKRKRGSGELARSLKQNFEEHTKIIMILTKLSLIGLKDVSRICQWTS